MTGEINMNEDTIQTKRLIVGDLKRANVPPRYYDVRLFNVPDHLEYKAKMLRYLERLSEMMDAGVGLYLWSEENSTGKTSLAVVVLKQALRLRKTAFFEEAGRLKTAIIEKEEFEDLVPIEQRIREVDLLVLDDVGKEYRTSSGFVENQFESIVRERVQYKRTTIMTGNMPPKMLKSTYSDDFTALLKETTIQLRITGYDWREEQAQRLKTLLQEG